MIRSIDPFSHEANALNIPPGKYGRKAKTQRNRRGPAQAVEHVVQFDNKRGTLPRLDISGIFRKRKSAARSPKTGAAWLSSARAVRCSVKSGNERNPCDVLDMSHQTAQVNWEEGGDDVKSAWPSDALGYTHVTMGKNKGLLNRKVEPIPSKFPSVQIGGCNSPS